MAHAVRRQLPLRWLPSRPHPLLLCGVRTRLGRECAPQRRVRRMRARVDGQRLRPAGEAACVPLRCAASPAGRAASPSLCMRQLLALPGRLTGRVLLPTLQCDASLHCGTFSSGCKCQTCLPGWEDCNGQDSDGCEADLSLPATCGSCTTNCGAQACAGGQCAAGGGGASGPASCAPGMKRRRPAAALQPIALSTQCQAMRLLLCGCRSVCPRGRRRVPSAFPGAGADCAG